MIIENTVYRFKGKRCGSWLNTVSTFFATECRRNTYPLRFSIVDISNGEIVIESTIIKFITDQKYADKLGDVEILDPKKKIFQ